LVVKDHSHYTLLTHSVKVSVLVEAYYSTDFLYCQGVFGEIGENFLPLTLP